MQITLNGNPESVEDGTTVAGLVAGRGLPRAGVAVAVNCEVVTAHRWEGTEVSPGDRVEIVTARQGG